MAPSLTGTYVEIDSSAASGSQAITVPYACNLLLVMPAGWDYATPVLNTCTIAGAACTQAVYQNATNWEQAGIWYKTNPATGSQTFAWAWDQAPTSGATFLIFFIKDADTVSPIRGSGKNADNGGSNITTTSFSSDTDDFIVAVTAGGAALDMAISGQSEQENGVFNGCYRAVATKAGVSGTTTMTSDYDGSSSAGIAAVSIKPATGLRVRQFNVFQGSATAPTIAFPENILADSLIVVSWNGYDTGEVQPTVTDSQTNSYTNQQTQNYATNDISGQAYAEGCSAGATTVTVTYDQNIWSTIVAVEIVGAKASGALHGSNEDETGTGTAPDTGNVTTTVDDTIFVASLAHDSGNYTITEDGAFTLVFEEETQTSQMPISVIYRIVDTTVTESGSWTIGSSATYGCSVLVFEAEGGGASTELIVADSTHGHATDNTALVQAQLLAVNESLHDHTANNPDLAQAYLLVVAKALHGHTTDLINIGVGLIIANTVHDHTADNPALTQAFLLAATETLHGHTADNIDLVISLIITQLSYRWRNDDQDEANATWIAAENIDASVQTETPIRLRILIDATGNPSNSPYQLETRIAASADPWEKVDLP